MLLSPSKSRSDMKPHAFFRAAVLAAVTLVAAASSHAVSISVGKLEMMPFQKAVQVNLYNPSNTPKTFIISIKKWTSFDQIKKTPVTEDVEASEILASKPVIYVPAYNKESDKVGSVTIRLSVIGRSSSNSEYYRVSINDITPAEQIIQSKDGSIESPVSFDIPLQILNKLVGNGKDKFEPGRLVVIADGQGIQNVGQNIVAVLGTKKDDGSVDASVSRYIMPGEIWPTNLKPDDLSWVPGLQ